MDDCGGVGLCGVGSELVEATVAYMAVDEAGAIHDVTVEDTSDLPEYAQAALYHPVTLALAHNCENNWHIAGCDPRS